MEMYNGLIVQQLKTISFWPLGSGISCMPIRLTYHLNRLTHINPDSQYKSYKYLADKKNPIFTAFLALFLSPPTPEGNI